MEKAWETSTEGASLQGVHVSPFNTYENRAGLLKEFYFKSNSKNKRQNKNICFVRKLRTRGPQLSHFQTSAHLRPSSRAASLAFPAHLLGWLRRPLEGPISGLHLPWQGSSLPRSRPFSLPPACRAFPRQEL